MFLQRMHTVREVPLNVYSLNSSHVFILDMGLKFYVWCGRKCNEVEETEAIHYAQKLKVCEHVGKKAGQAVQVSFIVFLLSLIVQDWSHPSSSRYFVCANISVVAPPFLLPCRPFHPLISLFRERGSFQNFYDQPPPWCPGWRGSGGCNSLWFYTPCNEVSLCTCMHDACGICLLYISEACSHKVNPMQLRLCNS